MRTRLSTAARFDLREIAAHIAKDSPAAAARVGRALRAAIDTLGQHPERHPVQTAMRGRTLRRLIVAPFLVFYTITEDEVLVTRVICGERGVEAELRRTTDLNSEED